MFLKNFKKHASDKHSTTLKHGDGHELKIAHKGLSKKMRQQLDELPHYDGGGQVPNPDATPTPPVTINIGQQAAPKPVAPQAKPMVTPPPQQAMPAPAPQAAATPMPPPTAAPVPAPEQPMDSESPEPAAQDVQPQAAAAEPIPEDVPPEEKPAIEPKRQAPAQGTAPSNPDYEAQIYKQTLDNHAAAYYKDIVSGAIQPKTYHDLYTEKHDTLGKVGMLFGLLLSGAGSGLAHQPNAVLHMMDQQISNDLEAQKQNKTNALSMLQKYQQHQNDVASRAFQTIQGKKMLADTEVARQEAQALNYKNQMWLTALGHTENQINKLSPAQQQGAQPALGTFKNGVMQKVTQNNAQAATLLANTEDQWKKRNSDLAMVMPERAQWEADRHYPGFQGSASNALSGGDKEQIASGVTFQKQLQRFMDWTSKHRGDLNPADIKEGHALAAGLQGAYRQATHGGVYKSGEQDFISSIIDSNPTKFFNQIRVMPALNAVQRDSRAQFDDYLKGKGFSKGYAGYQDGSSGGASEEKAKTQTMDGVKYKKVPGGWQPI